VGEFRFAHSVETHGLDCGPYETYYQEFVICRGGDGRFDVTDWSAAEPDMDLDSDVAPAVPDDDMIQVFDAEDHVCETVVVEDRRYSGTNSGRRSN
jgi:hypothetical protein